GQVVFTIDIANRGDGTIYNPMMIQQCSPHHPQPVTERQLNTVLVGMAYVGEESLECTPNKHAVQLYNGKGRVKCILSVDPSTISRSGYSSPLMLELWYGYSETIRTDVTVRRV
ncbi:MAG: hypothetical protein ABEI52_09375, partial [Halobacteriaceae archaeon]